MRAESYTIGSAIFFANAQSRAMVGGRCAC
jgi:hypothetical protein